jgi:translation initiation factor IF-1
VKGKVIDVLPNATFRVEIEPMKKIIICTTTGKIRKNHVRVIAGDSVDVEISSYDISRGRIVFRVR